jgi:hypothetical protein
MSELEEKARAKYKIEIHFGPNRTVQGPNLCLILLYRSGTFFHGGGDDLAYWCLDCRVLGKINPKEAWKFFLHEKNKSKEDRVNGCTNIITAESMKNGVGFCPTCGKAIDSKFLTGQLPFYGTTRELSSFVSTLFRSLENSADIYCKFSRDDIRYTVIEKKLGSEDARRLRGLFIYPLPNLLKETAAGASLEDRFWAFFTA